MPTSWQYGTLVTIALSPVAPGPGPAGGGWRAGLVVAQGEVHVVWAVTGKPQRGLPELEAMDDVGAQGWMITGEPIWTNLEKATYGRFPKWLRDGLQEEIPGVLDSWAQGFTSYLMRRAVS
jgi:hypothetical protein